jgi:hypothetical protein
VTRTGIEPALARLKASLQDQHRTAPCFSVRRAATNPASMPIGARTCNARGEVGYSHLGSPMPSRRVLFQWHRRESNPHVRHGKATGCRYIMGAWLEAELSKIIRAPGGTRTLVAADQPTVGARGAVSLPLDDQCVCSVGLVGIEPTSSGLRDRCIALSATIPYQSARWELNPGHRPARMPVGRCVL